MIDYPSLHRVTECIRWGLPSPKSPSAASDTRKTLYEIAVQHTGGDYAILYTKI